MTDWTIRSTILVVADEPEPRDGVARLPSPRKERSRVGA